MLKQIPDFPNYQCDESGNIYSQFYGRTKRLTPCATKGYYLVLLCNKAKYPKPKSIRIHRVVAQLFVANPENKPQVNHIDGNKLNNHYLNLEWNTCHENIAHAVRIGIKHKMPKNRKDQSIPIIKCNLNGTELENFPSINEAARQLNITKKWISVAIKGGYFKIINKNKTWIPKPICRGYLWKKQTT